MVESQQVRLGTDDSQRVEVAHDDGIRRQAVGGTRRRRGQGVGCGVVVDLVVVGHEHQSFAADIQIVVT